MLGVTLRTSPVTHDGAWGEVWLLRVMHSLRERSTLGGVADCRGACKGSDADLGNGGGVVLRDALATVRCVDRSVPLRGLPESAAGRCKEADVEKGRPVSFASATINAIGSHYAPS